MFDQLSKLAALFLKASIRSDGFNLNYFKTLDFTDILNYAKNNLELLGAGASRIVFILSPKKVLKVAKNTNSLRQNEVEYILYTENPHLKLLTKVYDHHPEYFWLISELVRPINSSEFQSLFGFDVYFLENYIDCYRSDESEEDCEYLPVKFEHLSEKSKLFIKAVSDLVGATGLYYPDLAKAEAWGINTDNEIKLLDYGLL